MLLLHDGSETSEEEIRAAYDAGLALIVCRRGERRIIYGVALDGEQRNSEEGWTVAPTSLAQVLAVARIAGDHDELG